MLHCVAVPFAVPGALYVGSNWCRVRSISSVRSAAHMQPFRSYPVRQFIHYSEFMPVQGYMDAARAFQEEAGMPVSPPMEAEDARMHVRNAVEEGEIEEAIERVNDLNPDVSLLSSCVRD